MKLIALNLFVSICMFFNALGINSFQNPFVNQRQSTAIAANGTSEITGTPDQKPTGTAPAPTGIDSTPTPTDTAVELPTQPVIPIIAPTEIPTLTATETPAINPTESTNSSTSKVDSLVQSNKADFNISFKSPYLNRQNQITLKYGISQRLASKFTGAELSIKLAGDKPTELIAIPIQDISGESIITIKQGCETGCTLDVDLLQKDGLLIASASAEIKVAESFDMKTNGGEFKTKDSKISVKIGGKALKQDATFYVLENSISEEASQDLISHPFFIDAEAVNDGTEINRFDEPIQLIYSYEEGEFQDPGRWTFVTFNETSKKWEFLPTTFDPQNHQIIGYSDHLSEKGLDYNAIDKYKFDNLASAQTSLFTGAGTYSYPINIPAGLGGLTPSISLSYNSNTVDSASQQTQASWVGMGWNLDVGSISRNTMGTNDIKDDSFNLSVNGAGGVLIPTATGTDGSGKAYVDYKSENDNFYRIRRYTGRGTVANYSQWCPADQSYWVVWDKSGNQYNFGNDYTATGKFYYVTYSNGTNRSEEISKWVLTSQKNIFGQTINYSYIKNPEKQNQIPYYKQLSQSGDPGENDVEMYLDTITYGNFQIVFQRATSGRNDFIDDCHTNTFAVCAMDRYYLANIIVKASSQGNGIYDTTIRRYQLNTEMTGTIFPNIVWGYGGHTLTLNSIQEFGHLGNPLPLTEFLYGDGMHLTSVTNGYNGKVKFVYANDGTDPNHTIPWPDRSDDIKTAKYFINVSGDWRSYGVVNNTVAINPGGVYRFEIDVHNCANIPLEFHLKEGNTTYDSVSFVVQANGTYFSNLRVPKDVFKNGASGTYFYFSVYNQNNSPCNITHFGVGRVETRYRVVEKQLFTNVSSTYSQSISYQYTNPAINDFAHSGLSDQATDLPPET